jgi:hypothetical protein
MWLQQPQLRRLPLLQRPQQQQRQRSPLYTSGRGEVMAGVLQQLQLQALQRVQLQAPAWVQLRAPAWAQLHRQHLPPHGRSRHFAPGRLRVRISLLGLAGCTRPLSWPLL